MWKRYENATKEQGITPREESESEKLRSVLGDATNTTKSVKRLRVKGALNSPADGKENEPSKYLATLREQAQETPKSRPSLDICIHFILGRHAK